MTLTILDDTMTGDRTTHSARRAPGEENMWEVSWLPGRYVSRDNAITAMVLAEAVDAGYMPAGHRLWAHVDGWAAELGLTAADVQARTSDPHHPKKAGKNAVPDDPEAAG